MATIKPEDFDIVVGPDYQPHNAVEQLRKLVTWLEKGIPTSRTRQSVLESIYETAAELNAWAAETAAKDG